MSTTELMIDAVSRLSVSAGDTVVLRTDRKMRRDEIDLMRAFVRAVVPTGVECLVLDGGVRLGVLASIGRLASDGRQPIEERLREIAGKHDADGMRVDLELEAADEVKRLRRAEAISSLQLAEVREAIHQYHEALHRREHGGLAAGKAVDAIAQILESGR